MKIILKLRLMVTKHLTAKKFTLSRIASKTTLIYEKYEKDGTPVIGREQ